MYRLPGFLALFAATWLSTTVAHAAVTNVAPADDTYLRENNPSDNFGDEDELIADGDGGDRRWACYRFDLSGLPAGQVTDAELQLEVTREDSDGGSVRIHPILKSWNEGDASWGSVAAFVDTTTTVATFTPNASGSVVVDVTSLAQSWVAGGEYYGLALVPEAGGGESSYTSREWDTLGERPQLVVTTQFVAVGIDIDVAKTVDVSQPAVGDSVRYTVTIQNQGVTGATGVEISDKIPSGLTLLTSGVTRGSYDEGTGLWDVGSLASLESASLFLLAEPDDGTEGLTITNVAALYASDQPDLNATNDADSASVTVRSSGADLAVTKTVDQPLVQVGDEVTYTITIENVGTSTALGANVTDVIPSGLSYESSSATRGSYSSLLSSWSVGNMSPGAFASLELVASVDSGTEGDTIWNVARRGLFLGADPNGNNDVDSVSVLVVSADLALTQTVDQPAPREGDTVEFAVQLENLGPTATSSVRVTDLLPTGLTYESDSTTIGSYVPGSGLWNIGDVASGQIETLWIRAGVDSATAGTTLVNTATVSSRSAPDPVAANDTATDSVSVQAADLAITLSASDSAPREQVPFRLDLQVDNAGPDASDGPTVVLTLPGGLSLLSVDSADGAFDDGSLEWSPGPIANGEFARAELMVAADSGSAGAVFAPVAGISAAAPTDPNATNDLDTLDITIRSADLSVTNVVSHPAPNEGDSVIYTVTVENLGPFAAEGVEISDPLPGGMEFQADAPSQGSYDDATGLWDVGDLAPGAVVTLALFANVAPGTALQTLQSLAEVSASSPEDPVAGNDSMSVAVTIPGVDLGIEKVADRTNALVNTSITFTIDVTNYGPDSATAVVVEDVIPPALTYESSFPTQGTYVPGSGQWSVGALAPGETATMALGTRVPVSAAGATVTNVATVLGADQAEVNAGNEADSAAVTIGSSIPIDQADLDLTMAVSAAAPSVGDSLRWTIALTNSGPDPAINTRVVNVLPQGLEYVGFVATQGSYNPSNGTWFRGTMTVGSADTLWIDTVVEPSAAGRQIMNQATAASNQPDPNGTASASSSVDVPGADLALTKTVDDALPTVGDAIAYTLTLVNLGPDATSGVVVADTIPSGLTFSSFAASRGAYSEVTGHWTIGALAAPDTATLTLFADVDAGREGDTLWNLGSVFASDEGDTSAANDVDSVAVRVTYADLAVAGEVDDTAPGEGDPITWTTLVENLGPDATATTTVNAPIPGNLTYVTHRTSAGSYVPGTGAWDVGALPALAAPETLFVDLLADPATSGTTVALVSSVSSDQFDPQAANDADSTSLTVAASTGLVIGATQTAATVNPGDDHRPLITLSVANTSLGIHSISEIRLANETVGPGTPAELDAQIAAVRLHQDDGDGTFERGPDLQLATGSVVAGEVVFDGLSLLFPPFAATQYHVVVDVATDTARDGDLLDLALPDPGAIVAGGAAILGSFPIRPAGGLTIDGLVAAQIDVLPLADTDAEKGTSVLALAATLPPNGYATDTLQEFRVANDGTAGAAEFSAVKAWKDGGDGSFDAGAGDDVYLGLMNANGGTWDLGGQSEAIGLGGLPVWVSVDLAPGGTAERTVRFVVPTSDGVVTAGANDGPLDTASPSSRTITITEIPTPIRAQALAQESHLLQPGAKTETVFEFLVINEGGQAERLESITLTNTSAGTPAATQADLDASWDSVEIQRVRSGDDLSGVGGGGDAEGQTSGVNGAFAAGTITFDVGQTIAAGDSARFRVSGQASLVARDGDTLDLRISAPGDLVFASEVDLLGAFPLDPAGDHLVDGMTAAQLVFADIAPSLLTGTTRNLALDVVVPANGYEDDTLLRFDLVNLGDAQPGEDIERVELWIDDGSGDFDPALDARVGDLLFTGDRWERTGIDAPVIAGNGLHLYVTVDVAELATAGRVVQLAVAGPPDAGLGMQSDNDGPIDDVAGGSGATISTVDRVTFSPLTLVAADVAPGDAAVPLLAVAAENSYTLDKTLTSLTLANTASGAGTSDQLDDALSLLTLWADDGDGTFEGAPQDTALATSFFESGLATFTAFDWALAGGQVRRLFVTGEVSVAAAADGDVLSAHVAGPTSFVFSDATSLTASWPLSSGAAATVDGIVAAQVTNVGAPAATLGSGEGPQLALDLVLPSNGYLADELNSFTVRNLGDADDTDLAEVRLWRDGGDGVFDAGGGDDLDLGALASFGGDWTNPSLSQTIPPGGARVFVSVLASASPRDSATVQLAVPVDGLDYASDADGPHDAAVANPQTTLVSTGVLLATLELGPAATIINSTVTATMTVRNQHPTATLESVTPALPLEVIPSAGLTLVSGPSPASHSLLPGEEKAFTWTYDASFIGDVRVRGFATGTEAGGGPSHQSLTVQSNPTQIFVGAQTLDLYAVESMPFSINRGQSGVVPMTLTFENPSGPNGTDIELTGLRLRLEDEQGGGIVPADLLSRVVINEGAVVYLDKTSLETSGAEIDLTLATPVLIESSGSSSQATIGVALDLSDSTSVPNFLLRIVEASWFDARDATTGGPVTLNLQDPPDFPVSSGLARVVAEATRLDVAGNALPDVTVGQGQSDVVVLDLTLGNPDPSGLAADVRVTEFAISVCDSAGVPIATPRDFVDRLRVMSPSITHLDYAVSPGDGAVVALPLQTLISVPVNTPVPLSVIADLHEDADLASFRVTLADTSGFDARDANTGTPLPVVYAPAAIAGPVTTVQAPAEAVRIASRPLLPSQTPVGSVGVAAMELALSHPGTEVEGPVELTSLLLQCRDDANAPVVPSTVVDRLVLRRGDVDLATVTDVPVSGGEIVLPVTGVVLAPGASDTLRVHFDVEVTASADLFGFSIPGSGVTARDANLDTPVPVEASGGDFPLSSGLTQLEAPARSLAVGFLDQMPATLVADGGAVSVATITLRNAAAANAGTIRVDEMTLRASGADGLAVDLGACVASLTLWHGETEWATSGPLEPAASDAAMVAATPLDLGPDEPVELRVEMELREVAAYADLRLGFVADDVGVVQPESPLLSISVLAEEGDVFPFWTEPGTFRGRSLEESYSNFPNPFAAGREATTIAFYLPEDGAVSLKVYSMRGELVRTLLQGDARSAGLHQDLTWDGRNGKGVVVVNGVYLAEFVVALASGGTEKMIRKVAVVR